MASIIASAGPKAIAEKQFRAIQDVLELSHADAPVKLDDDSMLALQIVLDLDVSAAMMEEIKEQVIEKLDPRGTGFMNREVWVSCSTAWHASGKSFLDFVSTKSGEFDYDALTPQLRHQLSEEDRNIFVATMEGQGGTGGPSEEEEETQTFSSTTATGKARKTVVDPYEDEINRAELEGRWDIWHAAKAGRLNWVKAALENNRSLLMCPDMCDRTPLYYASLGMQPEVVGYLLSQGASDPDGTAEIASASDRIRLMLKGKPHKASNKKKGERGSRCLVS